MPSYRAPVDDWLFLLNDFLRVQDRHELPGYADLTPELCTDVLRAAARFHEEVLFPVGIAGDAEGARLVDAHVRTPPGYREAWQAYRESGWLQLSLPEEIGGAGLPAILSAIVGEMRMTTAHSLAMYGSFCASAARVLHALGDPWMREHIVPKLASGEWTATMCLTESHCGTDLRQLRTRARACGDGRWQLEGSKIFISGGDHDLTENIIHIVLAKVPDADGSTAPGLGAVNVFVVSKRRIDPATGALGESNAVSVSSIEHKMGIEGSATCVLNFDEAEGWRVGGAAPGKGAASNMAAMFLLMNYARVSTALSGVGYAELASQNALAYARERLSGRAADGARHPDLAADPILVHPDIRRLLMGAQAFAEGGRAAALRLAVWQAEAQSSPEAARRARTQDLIDVLTPVFKAYFTDQGFACANDCLQVLGGHGYVREHGLEQMVRNARVGQIYEGANGIQAVDLVQRKLPAGEWRAARSLLAEMSDFVAAHADQDHLQAFIGPVRIACEQLDDAFARLASRAGRAPQVNLACAYDVLEACGIAVIGWTWAAIAAKLHDSDFLAGHAKKRKLALAHYWIERRMPLLTSLCQRIASEEPASLMLANDEF